MERMAALNHLENLPVGVRGERDACCQKCYHELEMVLLRFPNDFSTHHGQLDLGVANFIHGAF